MRNNSLMIIFGAFLLVIIGGGLFAILTKEGGGTAVSTNTVADKVTRPQIIDPEETQIENNLVPEGWKSYSNADLKFSINYPKNVFVHQGSCEKITEGSETSYRPKPAAVPIKIFEDTDGIFIAPEFIYELSDPKTINNVTYFGGCEKKSNTLSGLKVEQISWHIQAKTVPTKEDLETFVQTQFGAGCSVGTMTSTPANNKVYDVRVEGDGLEMPETLCGINYIYVLKYVPDAKMVYTYKLGQAYSFAKDSGGSEYYDEEMNQSFHPIF
ncbi:hypothetical protein A3K01_04090 [candidate division WWE3 bacterium RIFOXYD1_FULL_43_17]|uniref:Uncharacterized protein n=3 Tax=Katanobacteria TaxID=422282 RepID=A0A1F4XDY7_UNCKA|nr:MAG: hypothetical protein A3K01_04090 [candidate division WWE3 bacterium RIFOXYD1_FULL_43_17]